MNSQERVACFRRIADEASRCVRCREQGLVCKHPDGRWAYPLFHQESRCTAGVILVAEAPNFDDTFNAVKGRLTCDPGTDPSGRFMFDLLASVGLSPPEVLFTNVVLCLPRRQDGKHPVTAEQARQCQPWLERLIQEVNAEVVVTLGGQALQALNRIEKHKLALGTAVGRFHPWYRRQLLPLYHPSLLGRVSRSEKLQREDILVLRGYLDEKGAAEACHRGGQLHSPSAPR